MTDVLTREEYEETLRDLKRDHTISSAAHAHDLLAHDAALRAELEGEYQRSVVLREGQAMEKARADKAEAEVEERKRQLDALIQMRSDDIARWRAANARLTAAIKDARDTPCGECFGDGHDEPFRCETHAKLDRAIEEGK